MNESDESLARFRAACEATAKARAAADEALRELIAILVADQGRFRPFVRLSDQFRDQVRWTVVAPIERAAG